jgi:regulator of sigma E protease
VSTLLNWLLIAVGICGMFLILIAPHEGGHFLAAKLFKVRVIEFSVGAGPKLWSTTRNGTLYALRLVPILGYVRMGGMEAGDFDEPNGFHSKHPLQRIGILAAGPLTNFIVAMVLIAGFWMTQLNSVPGLAVGVITTWAVNGQTVQTPAAAAGLQSGDRIRFVNGTPVTAPDTIQNVESASKGQPVVISGTHADGKPFTVTVTPVCNGAVCRIGVQVAPIMTPLAAVQEGVSFPFKAIRGTVQGLRSVISGQVPGGLLGPQGMTGPIGIAKIAADSVSQGPPTYISLVALLSVVVGFTNLLPLLALDGGQILVVLIEVVRRRPFDLDSKLNLQRFGLVALLGLLAVISFFDIQRLVSGQFPGVH